jgi:hypothetical protein
VTDPRPDQSGQAFTPGPDAAWARPGATLTQGPEPTLPPAPPVPPPRAPQHTEARQGRGGRWVFVMSAVACLFGIAAIAMTGINLTRPAPPATTTTVTAPPPSYSPEQVAAAKKESCDASLSVDDPLGGVLRELTATMGDRNSVEHAGALSVFQTVVMIEIEYMRNHTPPATPSEVAEATTNYIDAWIALGDAYTRELPADQIEKLRREVIRSGDRLNEVCR